VLRRIVEPACAALLCGGLALSTVAAESPAGYETPPALSPADVLPASLIEGTDFDVAAPLQSDGLMYPFVVDTPYGQFTAYGRAALELRIREVAALSELHRTSPVAVVAGSVTRGIGSQVGTAVTVVTHPVATVTGIPKGIAHLFHGFVDEGKETVAEVNKATTAGGGSKDAPTAGAAAAKGETAAKHYATRYFGLSGAERHWYEKLGVDPYTDNEVLRRAIHRTAKLDAAAGFGMRFVGIPSIPGIGDIHEVMDAIYKEDPATIRARNRATLLTYGLSAAEIDRWQDVLVMSPTRQVLLMQFAAQLAGVDGRSELFRHAIGLSSDGEARVYLRSVGLLVLAHREQPLAAILPGVRLPAAQRADGSVVVAGAFDSVYWTADVAAAEASLRTALPEGMPGHELVLAGSASARVREELASRGWRVREAALPDLPAPGSGMQHLPGDTAHQ
jgi:hypothetical protein